MGDSSLSFSFCFCFAAGRFLMEDEEAFLLLWGRCLERRVDGGVERMFGMGFLGVGVEVEGVFAVETGSGGVAGLWDNGWYVSRVLFRSRYECAGAGDLGRCLHPSSCILGVSNAAIGNVSKKFHAFLFNVTLSHTERLLKSHCGITLFDKL